jgi:pimeloyl-ACP methyl ester carboxylesterase
MLRKGNTPLVIWRQSSWGFGMLECREYGTAGPAVVVVHGGPGGQGGVRGLAIGLSDEFRVFEPFQRRAGDESLTVARHVEDLREFVQSIRGDSMVAVVGHSWGAMLTLAFGAAHPDLNCPLVLVGCGTFDIVARARFAEIVAERLTPEVRGQLESLECEIADPDERLIREGAIFGGIFGHDLLPDDEEDSVPGDARGHEETWADMIRQQEAGVYPAAFAAITSPVLMLHGTFDPHPGRIIRDGLGPLIPQIEYEEWERCGHDPWRERHVRDAFFVTLRDWLRAWLRSSPV